MVYRRQTRRFIGRGHPFAVLRSVVKAAAFFLLGFLLTNHSLAALAKPKSASTTLQLASAAFSEGAPMPARYTCDDKNASPPLSWSGAPAGTKSFVLIADDLDTASGTWTHWVVCDLPAGASGLPEDAARNPSALGSARQGLNDFKHPGYDGPCPPPGKAHRFRFKLYALDALLELTPGATRKAVESAMVGHVLAEAQLTGTYQRK
jgi:Raf kinase inhibitor-like YbhB/YbcL family protein